MQNLGVILLLAVVAVTFWCGVGYAFWRLVLRRRARVSSPASRDGHAAARPTVAVPGVAGKRLMRVSQDQYVIVDRLEAEPLASLLTLCCDLDHASEVAAAIEARLKSAAAAAADADLLAASRLAGLRQRERVATDAFDYERRSHDERLTRVDTSTIQSLAARELNRRRRRSGSSSSLDPVEAVAETVEREKDAARRADAASAPGAHAEPAAVEALIRAVKRDATAGVRLEAVDALIRLKDREPRAAAFLMSALNNKSEDVRRHVAAQLGAAAIPELVRLLRNPDVNVCMRAVDLLGQLGFPEAFDTLLVALADSRPAVRKRTIEVLAARGGRGNRRLPR